MFSVFEQIIMFLQAMIPLQQTMHAHCRWPPPARSSPRVQFGNLNLAPSNLSQNSPRVEHDAVLKH